MTEKEFNIVGEEGLHARPTSMLVHAAATFKSDITIAFNDKKVNMKSILGVMSLGVPSNATVTISADGEDESDAISRISEIMVSEGIGN